MEKMYDLIIEDTTDQEDNLQLQQEPQTANVLHANPKEKGECLCLC